ncbi:MAG: hypothetical protein ACLFTV_17150, partial [Desulfococcaceae bacterium]
MPITPASARMHRGKTGQRQGRAKDRHQNHNFLRNILPFGLKIALRWPSLKKRRWARRFSHPIPSPDRNGFPIQGERFSVWKGCFAGAMRKVVIHPRTR